MSAWKIAGITLGVFVAGIGLTFLLRGVGLVNFQFWGPKEEDAQREVYEHTKSYRDGNAQELRSMQAQYVVADAEGKVALKSIILHRADGIPEDTLPADLVAFITSLKHEVTR